MSRPFWNRNLRPVVAVCGEGISLRVRNAAELSTDCARQRDALTMRMSDDEEHQAAQGSAQCSLNGTLATGHTRQAAGPKRTPKTWEIAERDCAHPQGLFAVPYAPRYCTVRLSSLLPVTFHPSCLYRMRRGKDLRVVVIGAGYVSQHYKRRLSRSQALYGPAAQASFSLLSSRNSWALTFRYRHGRRLGRGSQELILNYVLDI